ncbi:MAG: PAS domain S-box protein [Betaproteobacteria bacterium]|nr:PAS domain S-box protein [Betaproteobacteria bacterium]
MALDLVKSVALLLALSLSYSFTIRSLRRRGVLSEVATGFLFAAIAMVAVLNPVSFSPGLQVNGSTVVLSMAAAVGGPVAGGLAAALALLFYLDVADFAGLSGVLAMVVSTAAGFAYHQWGRTVVRKQWLGWMPLFSLVSQLLALTSLLFFHPGVADPDFSRMLSAWLIYASAAWGLGRILDDARQRLQGEDALRAHEARLRATVHAIPDLLCLLDKDGKLVEVLSQVDPGSGMNVSGMVGHTLHDVFPASEADRVLSQIKATLQTSNTLTFEIDLPTPIGPRRLEGRTHALGSEMGEDNLVVLLARDVTNRHAAAEALRASEMRFRSLLQNISAVAVQGFTPEGTITYWNHASELFYGYSEEEVLGRNLVDVLVPPEARSEFRNLIAGMLESGRPPEAREMLLLHRTGREVPVLTAIPSGCTSRRSMMKPEQSAILLRR